jgi:hypothetical protein
MFHNEAKNGTKVSHIHKSPLREKNARKYATTKTLTSK